MILVLGIVGLGWGNLLSFLLTPIWFMSFFLLTPAITVLSFLLGIIGSSRARDAKNAQNVAVFIILPVFMLIGAQVTGLFWFTPLWTLLLALLIGLIDLLVLRLAVNLFQREAIVVKWQ